MRERVIKQAEHTIYGSLAKFQEATGHPSGILTVMHGGLPIDIRHNPRGFDTTTVFFHAAIDEATFPVFIGAGVSEALPTNRVFISDPSLYLDEKLKLAWYAGNHKQDKLQWVVRGILRSLIPADQRVVMFGSSGGGFAALYYSAFWPGSTAVPINPQTNLERYLPAAVDKYARLGWGLKGANLARKIPATTDLVKLYRSPRQNRVFYIQNQNDTTHMTDHLGPFMAGLPGAHAVHPVLADGAAGHKPPPKPVTQAVLAAAVAGAEAPPTAPN